jgi:type VI secretion system protein ImpJ
MTEPKSLARVDWKLGQALMPAHFLWQEDSLRSEFEARFAHQSRPMWGVARLVWDEAILRKAGRLILRELQLVFETGLLIDVPGNARSVALDLVEDEHGRADVFLYLVSTPDLVRGAATDQEGSLIELRMQKLELSQRSLKTPQPGFYLGRFVPDASRVDEPQVNEGSQPKTNRVGWRWDASYVPPLIYLSASPAFAQARLEFYSGALAQWMEILRAQAVDNGIAVHKRVEAQLLLRSALGLQWYLHQLMPGLAPISTDSRTAEERSEFRVHPFELYERLVALYLDVHSFRTTPQQTLQRSAPRALVYAHEDLARTFDDVERAITEELSRPRADSPQWPFVEDQLTGLSVCELPKGLSLDSEVYLLVQFQRGSESDSEEAVVGLDPRLLGLKLADPDTLDSVERRALPGIVMTRVKLVPFPHDFDTTVTQFYRLQPSEALASAKRAGKIAYRRRKRPISSSYLYSPDAVIEIQTNLVGAADGSPRLHRFK